MIGIIIVSHGYAAKELLHSAEMIIGRQDKVRVVSLTEGMSPEALIELTVDAIKELSDNNGILILTDLYGGSTTNFIASALLKRGNVEIVSGVNLPMLLSVLSERSELSLKELSQKAVVDGKEGIINVKEFLKNNL
jgi:mannose/fructose/sorbose-specific phosphotransferase system IIA component